MEELVEDVYLSNDKIQLNVLLEDNETYRAFFSK